MSKVSDKLIENYENYMSQVNDLPDNACSLSKVILDENSTFSKSKDERKEGDIGIDGIYITQHQIAMKWFMKLILSNEGSGLFPGQESLGNFSCIDVGSQVPFVATMAAFANFIVVDPALNLGKEGWGSVPDLGLTFVDNEGQNLSFINENTMCIVTSMHAIEHFGLGRYGDSIDPLGDIRAIQEFNRILRVGGWFIGSAPIVKEGDEHVSFHKNRLYSVNVLRNLLENNGFEILEDIVATTTDAIKKTVANYGGGGEYTFSANYITPIEYEKAILYWQDKKLEKANSEELTNTDSAYIWLARKKPAQEANLENE